MIAQTVHGQATLTSSEDDPSLRFVQDLLLDFVASGVRFAVIHGRSGLACALSSDLDIALGEHPFGRFSSTLHSTCRRAGFRIVSVLHYEVPYGYYFIIATRGDRPAFVHLDCLYDPWGVSLYPLPTPWLIEGADSNEGYPRVLDDKTAVYLLIKRAVKGAADDAQAAELRRMLDNRSGKVSAALTSATSVRAEDLISALLHTTTSAQAEAILRQLRWRLARTRLVRHPVLWSHRLFLNAIRRSRRLTLPTGFFVVLIGPDGCGKSAVAVALLTVLARGFRRTARFHWRPGLLPKLGRQRPADPDRPTARATQSPYRRLASLARFIYYSFDFVAGYWLRLYPARARTGLIVGERYYVDVRVNPARYGFAVPQWLSEFVAQLVPKPDLTVLLTNEAEVIHARKQELSVAAIHDQLKRFEAEVPRWGEHTILKTDVSPAAVAGVIADHILALCEARTAKRLERSGSHG